MELINNNEYDYTFLVPKNYPENDFFGHGIVRLTAWKRQFSGYMKEFDLVHLLYQSPSYSFRHAQKSLMTVHDINFMHVKNTGKRLKYKRKMQQIIDAVDSLCFISEFAKNDTNSNLNFDRSKRQRVIYNGVTDSCITTSKPAWCPVNFLFSIGIFTVKKNFHTLIPLLKSLPDTYTLVIAGDCNTAYGNQIKKDIADSGLDKRVILPGMISEEEKNYLYTHCEAFLFPSIAEGFGLPVIEAMKCGKPVFCSDRTSLKEIGNEYAYFWKNFEPSEMREIFAKGMADFDNIKAEKEIKYANSFTWKKNVDRYVELYKELINE
ncbi:MAG: glycosyltransferase family 4 protein [Gammaproteobacteria bacterium]|nr:glycosyltransferase family 4 protein [Gammaproteobacteria bacterium]